MGYPLFLYLFLHLVFFLDRGTRYCDTPTMNDPYIKLIKQKERESKDGFKRAREIVKAFAKYIKFPSDGNGVSVVWVPLDELLPMCKSTTFRVGNYVYFKSSKVAGKILAIDQKMGAITHDAMGIRSASVDRTMETISEEDAMKVMADPDYEPVARYETMEITKNYDEFDAPHHYEDTDGNWIWPDWAEKYPNALNRTTVNTVNSISNYQRLTELNVEQQVISVIKQDSINQIIAEFNRLLVTG